MDGVEALRLFLREMDEAGRHDPQFVRLENLDDVADVPCGNGVRLNNRQRAFDSHKAKAPLKYWIAK
ncbi:hypothetical protein D3C83_153980 [compost metagenome]